MKKTIILILTVILLAFILCACDEIFDETNDNDELTVSELADDDAALENPFVDIGDSDKLSFVTEDIYGNVVSSDDFSEAKLIMLNFWEPWCGPCVGEMPDLERVYQKYKDKGFVILGAFSTPGQDESVMSVIDNTGVTYPIIRATEDMVQYMTEYVPTTVFFDGSWRLISSEPFIGANSYEDWDEIIGSAFSE